MKKHLPTYRKSVRKLAVSVATTAASFGLVTASARLERSQYYVIYRTPNGRHLVSTEPAPSPRTALFAFEKALFNDILRGS